MAFALLLRGQPRSKVSSVNLKVVVNTPVAEFVLCLIDEARSKVEVFSGCQGFHSRFC